MLLQVTALYAALLGIVGLVLMGLVGWTRGKTKISLNDGNVKPVCTENQMLPTWRLDWVSCESAPGFRPTLGHQIQSVISHMRRSLYAPRLTIICAE